jgi:hypothetical protein
LKDFAPFVIAALRAYAMLHARLLTIRTDDGLGDAQRIMSAAFAATRFRMTTFWIWHNYSNYILDLDFVIFDFNRSHIRIKSRIANLES